MGVRVNQGKVSKHVYRYYASLTEDVDVSVQDSNAKDAARRLSEATGKKYTPSDLHRE